jgi:uncharacterized protein YdiU (UPF0061 family)
MTMLPLDQLPFDNRFTRELPADPLHINEPRAVCGAAFSFVQPRPASAPRTLAVASEVAELLGIDDAVAASADFAAVFSGSRIPRGAEPHAACYGGYQFGHWADQLGDGRAIVLGEVRARDGSLQALQLKGAGPTPYARFADGLAVLRSSLREFLCSEAMHHLGIPTTRALSLVATGDSVTRDMFYDGHPVDEPGAVVCRVAPSFLRFGSYELCTARRDVDLLRRLADHTIAAYFPAIAAMPAPERYASWFDAVARSTATLVVEWMRVGFVHGVMNTDNMSILGLTIDYGPYGWIDHFDPDWTPNTTDAEQRRYRYGNQPAIAYWNLMQLAKAILPLVRGVEWLKPALDTFPARCAELARAMLAAKLGLRAYESAEDESLAADFLRVLVLTETDLTIAFRALGDLDLTRVEPIDLLQSPLADAYYGTPTRDALDAMSAWLERYRARVRRDGDEAARRERIQRVNPRFVLRNYLAQVAIDAASNGDIAPLHRLLAVLRHPYTEQPNAGDLAARRPDWARSKPGCSQLSCSS